jgi:hypothetical protein
MQSLSDSPYLLPYSSLHNGCSVTWRLKRVGRGQEVALWGPIQPPEKGRANLHASQHTKSEETRMRDIIWRLE